DIIYREQYPMPAGSNPYLIHYHDGAVFSSLWVHGGVGVIDVSTGATEVVTPFCNGPQGIFADDGFIYTTAGNLDPISFEYGPGQIWKLGRSLEIISMMEIGTNPQQIIEGPDGNLHVICTGDYGEIEGAVYIIDREEFEIVDSVLLGGTPQRLALDASSGIVYSVTSLYESWVGVPGSGRILAYDGNIHDLIWSVEDSVNALSGTGLVGFDVLGGYAYIPSMDSSYLEIVELEAGGVAEVDIFTTGYGPLDVQVFDPAIIGDEGRLPGELAVNVYPNPFNSAVTISLDFEVESRSVEQVGNRTAGESAKQSKTIEIFDVSGRRVYSKNTTNSSIEWIPGEDVSSGIYLVRISAGEAVVTKKIVYSR
ncbi:MAG: T9SS type A sorting domain-containing protein, partial [bacterium]